MLLVLSVFAVCLIGGVASVVAYRILHRLPGNAATADDFEFGRGMAFRTSAVYALVVGLSFSTTLADFEETEESVDDEIVALGSLLDIYRQLDEPKRFAKVREYAAAVLNNEYNGGNAIRGRPDSILDELYGQAFDDLQASKTLAADALRHLESARALRIQRVFDLRQGIPWFFWFFSIAGLLITLYAMSSYKPNAFRMQLVFGYGAMIALVLFMIYEMDTPFAGSFRIDSEGFQEMNVYFGEAID